MSSEREKRENENTGSKPKPHLALLMMVKNEKKRLHVTLNSVVNHVDSIVIYDTGSTDNTIEILETFSQTNNIPLHLKRGEFEDFATSRNVSISFAESFPHIDYLLLLDTNDELKGGEKLREFIQNEWNTFGDKGEGKEDEENTAYLVCQEWWSGKYDKYYNVRLIKAREGWKYRGSVHEWMKNERYEEGKEPVPKTPDGVVLYQDRTQDDDKTGKRFRRDKELLLRDHRKNRTEPRTVFYLAQTCACLREDEDAFYYYKMRSGMEGFYEERFHAYLRAGEASERLSHDWHDSMTWYMKAFEFWHRVEPLLKIADHYIKEEKWLLAYTFLDLAVKLHYPDKCILFVDKLAYDYARWKMMGFVGSWAGFFNEGKAACEKAVATGVNREADERMLKFYLDKEEEKRMERVGKMGKKEFMLEAENRLRGEGVVGRRLKSRALLEWKRESSRRKEKMGGESGKGISMGEEKVGYEIPRS